MECQIDMPDRLSDGEELNVGITRSKVIYSLFFLYNEQIPEITIMLI